MQEKLYLRSATVDDMNILFDWANEPSVRKNSFNCRFASYSDFAVIVFVCLIG